MRRVWLITGSNRGLGRAFATEAAEHDDVVVAGTRRPRQGDPLFERGNVDPVRLDVTDEDQVRAAVDFAVEKYGRIDVLVNNAGYGMSGAFEEVGDRDLRDLMETDYFGTANMVRAVVPHMRERGSGMILNVASQGGLMGFGGSTAYCSAKFAVVGLSVALRMELEPLGVQVCAVCPGSFRTDFRASGSMRFPDLRIDAYDGTPAHVGQDFLRENTYTQAGDPAKAAAFVWDVVDSGRLPVRLLIGEACCDQVLEDLASQATEIESYRAASSRTDF